MSDQNRISPKNIDTKPGRQVMAIEKNINNIRGLLVDPITNSQN